MWKPIPHLFFIACTVHYQPYHPTYPTTLPAVFFLESCSQPPQKNKRTDLKAIHPLHLYNNVFVFA